MVVKKRFQILFVFLVIIGIILLVRTLQPLKITEVEIQPLNLKCLKTDQVEALVKDKNILLIDRADVKDQVLAKFPCVGDIEINYKFPKTLVVNLKPRVPLAGLIYSPTKPTIDLNNLEASSSSSSALIDWSEPQASGSGEIWLIDDQGVIFEMGGQDSNLPLVFIDLASLQFGQKLEKNKFQNLAQVFQKFKELAIDYSKSKIVGDDLLLSTKVKLALSLKNDIPRQLASLQLISRKAKIESAMVESIDLRFEKPVVVYSNEKRQNN